MTKKERDTLNYLRDKEKVCGLDKDEIYELVELEAKL